jgi:hypothetical protein
MKFTKRQSFSFLLLLVSFSLLAKPMLSQLAAANTVSLHENGLNKATKAKFMADVFFEVEDDSDGYDTEFQIDCEILKNYEYWFLNYFESKATSAFKGSLFRIWSSPHLYILFKQLKSNIA